MSPVRVLIADDSVVYRSHIRQAIEAMVDVQVVGAVSNGQLALDFLRKSPVDLLVLDLEMPVMDGLLTLAEMRSLAVTPKVVVFSSSSERGAKAAMEALRLGASDFVAKPGADSAGEKFKPPHQRIFDLLSPKVDALFRATPVRVPLEMQPAQQFAKVDWSAFDPKVVVIGSSTGGPSVLETIFAQIHPPVRCPILITQHMPPVFTAALAERLGRLSGMAAFEAVDGMAIQAGVIYVAPGNYHMTVQGSVEKPTLHLDQSPQMHSVRPAVDPLFVSAAALFRNQCLGLVLTGMGYDGGLGAVKIKENGGAVLIQSKQSCVVFGMPGAVQSLGAYDSEVAPSQLIEMLKDKLTVNVTTKKPA